MRSRTTKTSPVCEGCSGSIHVADLRIVAHRDWTLDRHPAHEMILIASLSVSNTATPVANPRLNNIATFRRRETSGLSCSNS
jgi:hypothetical protein